MSENIMYKNIADKMKEANKEIEELKADNQELQDAVVWWNNRYNALQRDYEDYKSRCEKANWWLKEMLKQAKSNETKAIINGALELLLNGRSDK